MLSSPTLEDAPIHAWFSAATSAVLRAVPACGTCTRTSGERPVGRRRPRTARLHCPECDHRSTTPSASRSWRAGEWRAEKPDRSSDKSDRLVPSLGSVLAAVVAFGNRHRVPPRARAQKAGDAPRCTPGRTRRSASPSSRTRARRRAARADLLRRENTSGVDVPEPAPAA
jgi:hypothetical protein